jgi:hypothetical protein
LSSLSSGRGLGVGSRLTGSLTNRPGDPSRMIQPLQLSARGLVFDVLAAGPPTGEPVVLLHGFPQTSACWRPLLATLAAAGYRAVAPDQRGYSPKARPATIQAYRLSELVADVLASPTGLAPTASTWSATTGAGWWPGGWPASTPTGWPP